MRDAPREDFPQASRTNGWDCSWHILQVVAWLITFYFIAIFFGCFAPNLVSPWNIVSYSITGVSTLGLMVTLMTATALDPADPAVRAKGGNKSVPKLDRTKNKHAIENQTCALCQVIVGPKSKHCSACNKCVSGFDHHCRWLNNCVGDRNYKWFFSSLIFGLLASLMVNIVGVLLFVAVFTDEGNGNIIQVFKDAKTSNASSNLKMFSQEVDDDLFLAVDAVTVVLALLAFVLMLHLMQFHIWLMCKGLTTYDFIIQEREKVRVKHESAHHHELTTSSSARSQTLKANNKITPSKQQEKPFSRGSVDEEVKQYQKALAEKERMDGGETPPPLATPIYKDDKISWQRSVVDETDNQSSQVRKMKKKKKKKNNSSASHDIQIATIDNLSSTPEGHYSYHRMTSESSFDGTDDVRIRRKQQGLAGSLKNGRSTYPFDHPYGATFEPPPADARLSPIRRNADAASGDELSVNGTVDELNTTTMFSVNKNARLNRDGSLSYPGQGQGNFRTLPLTPIPKQKWKSEGRQINQPHQEEQLDVPPLDFSALRASTESSNSFKPYSGTTRSVDTYRNPPFDQKTLPPLKTLPETVSMDGQGEMLL